MSYTCSSCKRKVSYLVIYFVQFIAAQYSNSYYYYMLPCYYCYYNNYDAYKLTVQLDMYGIIL